MNCVKANIAENNLENKKIQFSSNTIRDKFKSESIHRIGSKPLSIPKYQLLSPSVHEKRNIAKPQTSKKYGSSYRIYFEPRKDMYQSKILVVWFEGIIGSLNPKFFSIDENDWIYLRAGKLMIR